MITNQGNSPIDQKSRPLISIVRASLSCLTYPVSHLPIELKDMRKYGVTLISPETKLCSPGHTTIPVPWVRTPPTQKQSLFRLLHWIWRGLRAHLMRLLGGWDGSLPSFLPWNIGLQNFMDLFDMISIVSL